MSTGGRPPRTELTERVNYFAVHYEDALACLRAAAAARPAVAPLCRAAILNFHVALEALQNRIYAEFVDPKHPATILAPLGRLPRMTRWYLAPALLATGKASAVDLFKVDREPWQTVQELVDIRNSMAHRRPESLELTVEGRIFAGEGSPIPTRPTDPRSVWPHTRIPRHPDLLTVKHVTRIKEGVDQFVVEVSRVIPAATSDWVSLRVSRVNKIIVGD